MDTVRGFVALGAAFGLVLAALSAHAGPPPSCAVPGLDRVYVGGANLYSGAAPDAALLTRLKGFGVAHVIDLRPASELEDPAAEAALAAAAGMDFQRLPVTDPADLNPQTVAALDQLLSGFGEGAVYVHCVSGTRAGALLAYRERLEQGKPADAVLLRARGMGVDSDRWLSAVAAQPAASLAEPAAGATVLGSAASVGSGSQ